MEYIESSYYNTFYPFQNKHQIHQNMQTIKMCGYKNQNKVKIIKWTRLIETNRFLQMMSALYIPSLCLNSSQSGHTKYYFGSNLRSKTIKNTKFWCTQNERII